MTACRFLTLCFMLLLSFGHESHIEPMHELHCERRRAHAHVAR